ncbi:MAG: UDP-3-O-(3-hydroxymyristoyl)glucosamine N-acyltransferase [Xanthomonadales bacterium]|nr:UDP-3-O-(3-hydroxymyristoyl)glucosamine N-acyltransferase [Xanthomonadales bacterium]
MKLAEIAERFGLRLAGDGGREIRGVASLAAAGPGELSFLANPAYRRQLPLTRAGAVVLAAEELPRCPTAALVSENPYADFARIAALFAPRREAEPGIHPSAVIEPGAALGPGVSVGPFCHVAASARLGAGSVLGPHCIVGPECELGEECRLVARVTLVERVRLGRRVLIHPGAVLGADGFGLALDRGRWLKVPQLAGVVVGDDCEIGANTTIDRGALEDTVLEEDVRLDNQIQIGHGVRIGAHSALAGCAAVAGSARIGRHCLIGGGAGIVGHIEICDRVVITARSLVTHSIREPGEYSSGTPLQENRLWRRNAARFAQLDRLARRLLALLKESRDE